jgi:hypothetical protein
MTDKQKLKDLLKSRGLTYGKIAEITGYTPDSVKSMLQPNKPIPRWCKLIVYMCECNHEYIEAKSPHGECEVCIHCNDVI